MLYESEVNKVTCEIIPHPSWENVIFSMIILVTELFPDTILIPLRADLALYAFGQVYQ